MTRRWLLWFAVAAATAASGCASGDGAPEARITNGFTEGCIVEASYLGYAFTSPIAPSGVMASREVYEGTEKAYAVVMPVPTADNNGDGAVNCYDTVTLQGGNLYVTKNPYTSKAGQKIDIVFNADKADLVTVAPPCDDPAALEGLRRFARLSVLCTGTP